MCGADLMKGSIIHSIKRATICQLFVGDRLHVSTYLSLIKSKSCPRLFSTDRMLVDGGNDSRISESKVIENLNVIPNRLVRIR